jgi:hypothetical protein
VVGLDDQAYVPACECHTFSHTEPKLLSPSVNQFNAPSQLPQFAASLVGLISALIKPWDSNSILQSPLAGSAQAAVQLAAAGLQCMCSYKEQQQQQQQQGEEGTVPADMDTGLMVLFTNIQHVVFAVGNVVLEAAVDTTANAASTCSRGSAASSTRRQQKAPHKQQQQQQRELVQQQLLLPADWRCVSGFMLAACCQVMLRPQQQQPAPSHGAGVDGSSSSIGSRGGGSSGGGGSGSGSNSSSIGGSSSSSSADCEAHSAGPAKVGDTPRAHKLNPDWQGDLPACHQQLLRRLGYNSEGVLWAADLIGRYTDEPARLLRATAAAHISAKSWVTECAAQQVGQPSGFGVVSGGHHLADAAADVLLASVLLHCAAHCSSHLHADAYVNVCNTAVKFAVAAWATPVDTIKVVAQAAPAAAAAAAGERLPADQLRAALVQA